MRTDFMLIRLRTCFCMIGNRRYIIRQRYGEQPPVLITVPLVTVLTGMMIKTSYLEPILFIAAGGCCVTGQIDTPVRSMST